MKKIQTDKAPQAIGPYSQGVCIGNLFFSSGQIALSPETGQVVGSNIEEQTQQVMANISALLSAANTSFDKVIKTTCFLKNMDDFEVFNQIYAQYFTSKPARSCVAVAKLPKDVLVEVEVIAQI